MYNPKLNFLVNFLATTSHGIYGEDVKSRLTIGYPDFHDVMPDFYQKSQEIFKANKEDQGRLMVALMDETERAINENAKTYSHQYKMATIMSFLGAVCGLALTISLILAIVFFSIEKEDIVAYLLCAVLVVEMIVSQVVLTKLINGEAHLPSN